MNFTKTIKHIKNFALLYQFLMKILSRKKNPNINKQKKLRFNHEDAKFPYVRQKNQLFILIVE